MKHPPYQLKTNKAVDRQLFAELLRWYSVPQELRDHTYFSLGGPYLEDFKLIHDNFPNLKMVCIEKDAETFRRQKFHLPCRKISLVNSTVEQFLASFDPKNKPSIFWLDNVGLNQNHLNDFVQLLSKVIAGSIIKITLQSEVASLRDAIGQNTKLEQFKQNFKIYLPAEFKNIPVSQVELSRLLQDMLQIAAQKTLVGSGLKFQLLNSFFYQDGVGMFTLTGIVCDAKEDTNIKSKFGKLSFCNLNWENPTKIDVPNLSTKERLRLQRLLPGARKAGQRLRKAIGYDIANSREKSVEQLQQYSDFCRYYPYFIRADL